MGIDRCSVHAIGLQDFQTVPARSFCIRPSTLGKGAGMGLFARRFIKGKRVLGEYKGISVDAHNPAYDSAYVFATSRGFIDARTVHKKVIYLKLLLLQLKLKTYFFPPDQTLSEAHEYMHLYCTTGLLNLYICAWSSVSLSYFKFRQRTCSYSNCK